MIYKAPLKALALAIIPWPTCNIFPALPLPARQIELARKKAKQLLKELQDKQQQLQEYAGQVEELTAMEERNRLPGKLHNSVSQTMCSILLNTRSAQIMLKRTPKLRRQLKQLQSADIGCLE